MSASVTRWRQHLTLANEVKEEAMRVKAALRGGELSLVEALDHGAVGGFKLMRVLCWLPGVGPYRAELMATRAGVGRSFLTRDVARLTRRQRRALDGEWRRCLGNDALEED